MGKVSMAVRSAAMSYIEPWLPTILGRGKMRMKLLKVVVVLLLSGSGDGRPQKTESIQLHRTKSSMEEWRPRSSSIQNIPEDSSSQLNGTQRHLKDLQKIDQSLRTVATQLLNVTNPEEPAKVLDNVIKKPNTPKPSNKSDRPVEEIPPSNVQSMTIGFGRPINSKFSYFESGHPGQAMAMTEEELEREMSSTRLMSAYKTHPTTTGGISTWILLNPPSTTVKSTEVDKKKQPFENEIRVEKPTTLMEKVETTERVTEKFTIPVTTVTVVEEASTKTISTTKKTTEKVHKEEPLQSTTKMPQTTTSIPESKEAGTTTTKKIQHVRTTPKPKIATMKTTVLSKPAGSKTSRPNQQARPKPANRRTTIKPDMKNDNSSTAKVEKVTFRPIQMITIPKTKVESTEKPMFVTKIKASVLMDQKTTTSPSVSSTTSLDVTTTSKTASPSVELVEVTMKPKVGSKVSNVLKVQLKKPVNESKIEEPKVNAPAVEKVQNVKDEVKNDTDSLDASRIDLMKFDFNPELTKINTSSESVTPATTTTSTTKRPRNSSKRKKNKVRRRKPATAATSTTTVSTTSTESELIVEDPIVENGIQESKIVPETKVATNSTKTKKKPPSPPFGMQIYNFLSREVMPSFGVMSLVGLGLGLASYFLYPFGGTIARRNYEVEPKYKYNFDEYGGNYGQSEEEVLAKVLQGMTPEDNKYPGSKDYDNYYRYQQYDGYETQTKKTDQRHPSGSPIYRPENTASILKYRNTDYRYPEPQSTPIYYDRSKPEYVGGQSDPANRQFVVGSVPKEYPPYNDKPVSPTPGQLANSYEPTESSQMFEHDLTQNFNFPVNPVQNYGQVQTARPEETYEEVEITPTAVAVEHGPRSLKVEHSRRKRDSVIQVIPSKRELEEEEKEDLSNEILNIIDSALPEEDELSKKKSGHPDFGNQKKRQNEEESTTKSEATKTSTTVNVDTTASTAKVTEPSTSSTTEIADDTMTSPKTTEQSSTETDSTTNKPDEQNGFTIFNFVKKIAEIKFRLGLTLLKHASESFARYLGQVQKRINGDE
ncbi:uncharacterized protein LOC105661746 isoform X2 [Megachile rotundata]|uniref:uncharacterized protein LOC105661746 isoform X2 n=1 Tax=Megachile rotundata TaxID=143995 RepID=UPI003FD35B95